MTASIVSQNDEVASSNATDMKNRLILVGLIAGSVFVLGRDAAAADLVWKGHTWHVTSGGMAGVCQGDPNNVTIDANGYLHFKISNNGGTWTASEMFTTDKLGFGTYQWQVDGPIDKYDKNIVLGLFPYGPAAGIGADGTNEIDIEYSRWGQANGVNGDWTDYPNSGKTIGELSYNFTLDSTLSTSRMIWTSASIQDFLIGGLQPVDSTTGLIKTWTYAPQNASTNIPQNPMPLGMNLWCFDGPPSNGQPIEIVIRDFQFVPEGAATGAAGGGGGSAGAGGVGGVAGAGGVGGASGAGGAGAAGRGGAGGSSMTGAAGGVGMTGAGGATGGGGASAVDAGASGASGTTGASGAGGGGAGAGGAAPASGGAGATGSGTAGVTSTGAGGAGGRGGADASSSGGCAVAGRRDASGGAFVALALVSLARRRRRA